MSTSTKTAISNHRARLSPPHSSVWALKTTIQPSSPPCKVHRTPLFTTAMRKTTEGISRIMKNTFRFIRSSKRFMRNGQDHSLHPNGDMTHVSVISPFGFYNVSGSTIPAIVKSLGGGLFILSINAASLRPIMYTVSPVPACLVPSHAMTSPFCLPLTIWRTTSSLTPSKEGGFTVQTTEPTTIPRFKPSPPNGKKSFCLAMCTNQAHRKYSRLQLAFDPR